MQRRLREQAICGRDAENTAQSGSATEEKDVPSVSSGFLDIVPWQCSADSGDFYVKEE